MNIAEVCVVLAIAALGGCDEPAAQSDPVAAEVAPPEPTAPAREDVAGRCSLEALWPELQGLVGQDEPALSPLASVSPLVANAHLRSEYAFIDLERAESMVWFSDAELLRMRGTTFETPRVRHVRGTRVVDGNQRALDLLVVFSPESEKVYVLERTREVPEDEYSAQREEIRGTDERALADFFRRLGARRLYFDVEGGCAIPAALSGQTWISLDQSTSN